MSRVMRPNHGPWIPAESALANCHIEGIQGQQVVIVDDPSQPARFIGRTTHLWLDIQECLPGGDWREFTPDERQNIRGDLLRLWLRYGPARITVNQSSWVPARMLMTELSSLSLR